MESRRKPLVKAADMPEEMKEAAVTVGEEALEKFSEEQDVAAFIKKRFDQLYGSTWHCIVGADFGSFVSHQKHRFIYLYLGNVAVLLFKSA